MIYAFIVGAFLLLSWRAECAQRSRRHRLLAILALAGRPMYPVEIRPLLDASFGTIYAILDELMDRELVTSFEEPGGAERDYRPKRYYALTEKGVCEAAKRHWN